MSLDPTHREQPSASLLRMSASARLALALVPVALIWAVAFWAMG
jgi:hypothetical protein